MARLSEHPELMDYLTSLERKYGSMLRGATEEELAPFAILRNNDSVRQHVEAKPISVADVRERANQGYSINQMVDELDSGYYTIRKIMDNAGITIHRFYTVRDNRGNYFLNVSDAAKHHHIRIDSIRRNKRRDGLRFEFGQWPIK